MASVRPRVLIVDDDPGARRLYGAYLSAAGFDVEEAPSGMDAVKLTEEREYAAVLMDLDMPGLDGWMTMSLIRARRPSLPMVILTAMADPELPARAKRANAAGFLTKPCTQEELSRTVERALRGG